MEGGIGGREGGCLGVGLMEDQFLNYLAQYINVWHGNESFWNVLGIFTAHKNKRVLMTFNVKKIRFLNKI